MSNRKYNFARAHNISLPSTKRKLNIDEATSALSSMGYRMGTVRHSLADKTSYWSVTTPTGSVVEVAANKLTDFVYGKIKNLNAQRYTETTYEVLFPDEDEDTQFIDSKEAAIKVARQYAAKGCTVELSQVIKTWRSKAEANAAQIPTNTKETPMRFFKGLNMNSTGAKAKFGDYYNNPADSSKKVNKLLPRIVAAIKAAGGQVDSVEKHDSKSSASIRFPTKGDYQVSIDIGSTYLAVNRYVIRGAGVLQSVHLFNGELSDIDKAVAIAVNEWKKLKAARRHFSRTGAKELHMKKSTYAVVHPSIAGAPLDPYTTKVPILLKDKTTVTAVRNDGRWSIEGRSDMPTSRKFDQLIAELNAAGFTRLGKKAKYSTRLDTRGPFKPSGGPDADITGWSPKKDSPQRISETVASYKKMRDDYTKALARMTPEYLAKNPSAESYPRRMIREANDYIAKHDHARNGAKAKFLLYGGIMDGIEKGIAKRMKSADRYRAQGNDEMAEFTEQDAEDLKRVKRALVQGNGDSNHAKQIAKMIQNLDTEVRRDCGDALIEWASRKAGVTINYARVGAKAKFGEVENLLNMISDQMNSGNNDLAKTNLRKLAAKIGEIRHTRSEWDQFMTVAKSLGFTESQIGGFSRRGSKATHAQVNIESHGVGSYYNSHLKEPKGTGSWSFIAPDGSILSAPRQMTLQAAKSWLKQNATINGYYKVAP